MKRTFTTLVTAALLTFAPVSQTVGHAAQAKDVNSKPAAGPLSSQELKQLMPASVFFAGQTAPVQLRNSAGFRTAQGKVMLIGLVDSSGYSSGVAQKYQAYLLTETALRIDGKSLPTGAYGVGFIEGDSFGVMDISGKDVFSATGHSDGALRRAVPLKLIPAQGNAGFRLYFGKRYVDISF